MSRFARTGGAFGMCDAHAPRARLFAAQLAIPQRIRCGFVSHNFPRAPPPLLQAMYLFRGNVFFTKMDAPLTGADRTLIYITLFIHQVRGPLWRPRVRSATLQRAAAHSPPSLSLLLFLAPRAVHQALCA